MTEWTPTWISIPLLKNQILSCLTRQSKRKHYRLIWQLTIRKPQGLRTFTMRSPQLMFLTRKKLSTSNFLTIHRPLPNQSYGVDLSTPFLSMDPSSTSHQTPRTSKSPLTSWLNISRTNRLIVVRLTNSLISMAWVMPSEILFLWSIRLNGMLYSLTKNLTHLGQKSL